MSVKRDEYGRYEWDEKEFEKRFQARLQSERAEKKKPKTNKNALVHLIPHNDFVDLNKNVNERRVIGENVPISKIGHFSCPVCQLYFRNSTVYLKHLNSPEHNEKMGMSMKIEDVTDEQVLERINQWEDFYTQNKPVPMLYKNANKNINNNDENEEEEG